MSERVLHHGARVVLLLALVTLATALFMPTAGPGMPQYKEGMVAPEDVIAKIPFSVPKTQQELDRDRSLAMSSVPPTFTYVPEAADTMVARLTVFFDQLDSAAAQSQRAGIERVLHQTSVMALPSQVNALVDPATRRLLRETALNAAARFIPNGVADAGQTGDITSATVTVRRGDVERSVPANEIRTQRDFFESALGLLPPGTAPDVRNVFRLILIRHIEFSYLLDVVVTERDRDAAARSVHTTKDEVLQGQAIVRAADRIGPTELQRLSAYEAELRREGLLRGGQVELIPALGAALLNLMLLAIFGLLLFFFRPEVYANFRWVLLIGLLVAVYFAAAAGIARNGLAHELLPIAFVGLPMAVLWDTRMALVLVLVLAGLTGSLPPFSDYGTVLVVMAGGAAAAMSVRAVRRRSQTWVSIAIIAAATALVLLGHGLATSQDLGSITRASMFSAGNATVSALLAMGFLWVFELFTGITTDQTLLEWADPTRPLLKRLSLEAPGTYAHSINVANLAEAAANGIGANGLLCRVGVYYHDVGKMLKPHYFVENQPEGRNPHDKLKPETSATIVREHVTEGVRLARDAKVPEAVVDFILQHHGTQRIGFFYEKAREEAGEDLDEGRFSYPGPRPQTKETALVMLADSCESAARAMRDPTPERVRDLIRTVIRAKIDDGQLDEAPLTLREVAQIEEQFVKILAGVMHRRIDYPATKHLTDAPSGEVPQAQASPDPGKPEA